MLNHVYTIYDKIAEEAGPVFVAKNDGIAQRSFTSMLRDVVTDHSDYVLLRVGTYESSPVRLVGFDIPVQVVKTTDIEEVQK